MLYEIGEWSPLKRPGFVLLIRKLWLTSVDSWKDRRFIFLDDARWWNDWWIWAIVGCRILFDKMLTIRRQSSHWGLRNSFLIFRFSSDVRSSGLSLKSMGIISMRKGSCHAGIPLTVYFQCPEIKLCSGEIIIKLFNDECPDEYEILVPMWNLIGPFNYWKCLFSWKCLYRGCVIIGLMDFSLL